VSIELPDGTEAKLRELAAKQGRELRAVVEEAIRQYLEVVAITDVDATDIAETQAAMLGELPRPVGWKAADS